jgi:hypothetical protein
VLSGCCIRNLATHRAYEGARSSYLGHVGRERHFRSDSHLFMRIRYRYVRLPWPAMTMIGAAELAQPGLICEGKSKAVIPGASQRRVAEIDTAYVKYHRPNYSQNVHAGSVPKFKLRHCLVRGLASFCHTSGVHEEAARDGLSAIRGREARRAGSLFHLLARFVSADCLDATRATGLGRRCGSASACGGVGLLRCRARPIRNAMEWK